MKRIERKDTPPFFDDSNVDCVVPVTQCEICESMGMHLDCPSFAPCQNCGGEVNDVGYAVWMPPRYNGIFFKQLIKPGYWSLII